MKEENKDLPDVEISWGSAFRIAFAMLAVFLVAGGCGWFFIEAAASA